MVFVHELFCCSPPLRCPRGALGGTRRASAAGTLPRWHPLLDTFTAKSSPRARRVLAPNPPVCSCRSVRAVCWLGLSENTARLARDGCRGEFLAQKGSRPSPGRARAAGPPSSQHSPRRSRRDNAPGPAPLRRGRPARRPEEVDARDDPGHGAGARRAAPADGGPQRPEGAREAE